MKSTELPVDQRTVIEGTCRQLMMRYAASLDLNDLDGLVGVFAPDLYGERPGMAPMRGHDDVRSFFTHFRKRRHTQNQHWFDVHMLTTVLHRSGKRRPRARFHLVRDVQRPGP